MSSRVTLENVRVSFTLAKGRVLEALGPVTAELLPGQFVALVGPSGCGKSTLLRVLAGLQAPTQGSALLDGEAIDGPSRSTAVMFQDASLMPWRTVEENIMLPLELAGVPMTTRREQAQSLLPALGLNDFARSLPRELSGGLAQRVALGRVLIQQPTLMLLDEPFGALDALTRERIGMDLLGVWQSRPMTILMVTHDIHDAILLADRVLVLSKRPGVLHADIDIALPRPRMPEQAYGLDFGELATRVRSHLEGV